MRHYFLFWGALLCALPSLMAQTNFLPAYILQLNGDTLYGEVDSRGDDMMGRYCRFRLNKKAEEKLFYPSDIAGFRFIRGKYFVAKRVAGDTYFLEFMIKGKINLYYRRDETGDNYYIEKENRPLEKIEYEERFIKQDGKDYLYQSKRHIRLLNEYTDGLPELAEDYHNAVCKDEACVIYEKELPFIKVNFEIGAGINNWTIDQTASLTHYNFRAYIWLPRSNENLYLKTGLSYVPASEKEAITNLVLPFQLTYIFPGGLLKPKFSGGFNYYVGTQTFAALGAGLNIKLTQQLQLSFNTEINLAPTFIIPRTFYALEAGLFLSLE